MPKCLHVVHVAIEVETDRISTLDNTIKSIAEAANGAAQERARTLNEFNPFGTAKIEVIG